MPQDAHLQDTLSAASLLGPTDGKVASVPPPSEGPLSIASAPPAPISRVAPASTNNSRSSDVDSMQPASLSDDSRNLLALLDSNHGPPASH